MIIALLSRLQDQPRLMTVPSSCGELLEDEAGIDAPKAERIAHRHLDGCLECLVGDDMNAVASGIELGKVDRRCDEVMGHHE